MFCPLCEQNADSFLPFGLKPRPDAMCPGCGSLERHRFVWLFLRRKTDLLRSPQNRTRVLHIAPEPCLASRLQMLPQVSYLSADLRDKSAMVKMDITDIGYGDNSFDVIFCSHVLEHIPDDLKAMTELRRILGRSGWAILLVPIAGSTTYEDPSITEPQLRELHFGQRSHVRRYGTDFEDRLQSSGFEVSCFSLRDVATDSETREMSLLPNDRIYFCKKRDIGLSL